MGILKPLIFDDSNGEETYTISQSMSYSPTPAQWTGLAYWIPIGLMCAGTYTNLPIDTGATRNLARTWKLFSPLPFLFQCKEMNYGFWNWAKMGPSLRSFMHSLVCFSPCIFYSQHEWSHNEKQAFYVYIYYCVDVDIK